VLRDLSFLRLESSEITEDRSMINGKWSFISSETQGIYVGYRVPFSAFFSTVETKIAPVMAYSFKLPKFIFSKNYPFKPQISVRLARMCAHYTSYKHVFQLTQFQCVFALIH
jgi:hypothetical protein